MAGRGRERRAWAAGASVVLWSGLALVSCSDGPPGTTCERGEPGCVCTARPDGTDECGQGVCDAARSCGEGCCAEGELCDQGVCVTAGGECIYIPKPGEFEAPERSWWWPYTDAAGTSRADIRLPEFDQVMSTPMVVRLRADAPEEPPAVIFHTFHNGGGLAAEGVLRVIRGDDGRSIFDVTDPALRVNGMSSPAVGDLDGDGSVEIVSGAWDPTLNENSGLVAFGADGSFLWRTDPLYVAWGAPAIAELDGVPPAEVILGSAVIDGGTGRIRCIGENANGLGGTGDNGVGPLSAVADIDADGRLEIVTGNMAYRLEKDGAGRDVCRALWGRVKVPGGALALDGFVAIADLLDDPALRTTLGVPEIAVVSRGHVRVHDWTGGVLVSPVRIPGGGLGGPPTVADFDGDGIAEIGVAGLASYSVFKVGAPGGILWSVETQDGSSSTTGSSVFDFDGNGRAEVVYADECYVRVYDGATGLEVFKAPNTSCTTYENPVVADVDGDGAAELLVGANDVCSITCPYGTHAAARLRGLQAFKSPSDSWVASRPVWNQHTYHVTNVSDSGGIPLVEPRSWGPGTRNSFRQNYQGDGVFAAPDLEVVRTRLDGVQCPLSLQLVAEVENAGARGIRAGLPVSFYEERDGARSLLGTTTLPVMLRPGERAELSLEWKGPPRVTPVRVIVRADDDGTTALPLGRHKECDETNNEAVLGEAICREAG